MSGYILIIIIIMVVYYNELQAEIITRSIHSGDITCSGGEECTIRCDGEGACSLITITCPTNYECNIYCSGKESCQESVFIYPENAQTTVECTNKEACEAVTWGTPSADDDYSLLCSGYESCRNTNVFLCPTDGDCSITCEGQNVCVDVRFQCPQNGHCDINCFSGYAESACGDGNSDSNPADIICPAEMGDCNIQCRGYESCEYVDVVHNGAGDLNQICDGEEVCEYGSILYDGTGDLKLLCHDENSCGDQHIIYSGTGNFNHYCSVHACTRWRGLGNITIIGPANYYLTCNGDSSCQYININSTGSGDLNIYCQGESSCDMYDIYKQGTGDLVIECYGNDACYGDFMGIYCSDSVESQCHVLCKGDDACDFGGLYCKGGPCWLECVLDGSCGDTDNVEWTDTNCNLLTCARGDETDVCGGVGPIDKSTYTICDPTIFTNDNSPQWSFALGHIQSDGTFINPFSQSFFDNAGLNIQYIVASIAPSDSSSSGDASGSSGSGSSGDASGSSDSGSSSSGDDFEIMDEKAHDKTYETDDNDRFDYTKLLIGSCIVGVCLLVILCLVLWLKCMRSVVRNNKHQKIEDGGDIVDVEVVETIENETEMFNI
eukprot:495178_1